MINIVLFVSKGKISYMFEYGIYYHAANSYGDLHPYKNNIKLFEWIECTISDRCVVKLLQKSEIRAIPI